MLGSLDRACGGSAQLVRLVGEAGIGKSRLVNEFIARVRDEERFAGCRGAAEPPARRSANSPMARSPRSCAAPPAWCRSDPPEEMRTKLAALLASSALRAKRPERLMPLLFHVLGIGDPDATLRHVEPEQLRRQILYAIRTIIERRLALSPLLIVVEDLHWADAVSLEALRFVMDRLERSAADAGGDPPAGDGERPARLDPRQPHRAAPVALEPGRGQSLLGALFGDLWRRSSGTLRDRILDRAGGNPLFIEEIVRGLIDVGVLKRDGPHWRIASDEAAAGIPASIQAMLLARVDRLPQDVRRLAQEAAVIGPRFDAALLRAVTADPARLEAGLELLCDFEIIEEVAGAGSISSQSYRFTQTLLQDVIYQNLLLQRRTEMHGRIGAALERLCGDDPERLEDLTLLGHHFSLSADSEKGARYLMAAGDRARTIYANDDALRLYQQALAALADDRTDAAQARNSASGLPISADRPAGARPHASTIATRWKPTAPPATASARRGSCARPAGCCGTRASASRRRRSYAEAATLLEGADAPIEQAHLLQERGRLAFRTGDHARAVQWADDALDCAASVPPDADRQTGAKRRLRPPRRSTPRALRWRGSAGAGKRCARSSGASRSPKPPACSSAACRGYTNLGVLYTTIDPARAIEVCRRGLEVARRIGDLGFQARLLANLAVACCTFTDRCPDEGVPAAEKAIEIDRALDQREHLSVPLIVLGQIHQCNGQPELAGRSTARRWKWRAKPASRSCSFHAMMGLRRSISTSTTWPRPTAILPGAGCLRPARARPGSACRAAVSRLTGRRFNMSERHR